MLRGQAQGRIVNDDLAQLSISDTSVVEGNDGISTATFVIQLSHPMPNPVTFEIGTANGSAIGGSDFVARSQTERFIDAGRTRQLFEVAISGDVDVEDNETFNVTISNVSGAALVDGSATGTIVNDEAAPSKARDASPNRGNRQSPRLRSGADRVGG